MARIAWKKKFIPTEKFDPKSSAALRSTTSSRTFSRCWYQPVVPTTIGTPASTARMMLGITACGVVKSTITSVCFSRSSVSARPSWFSLPSESTWCPRSRATSATSAPVLPRPRIRNLILIPHSTDLSAPTQPLREHLRIHFCKKSCMQSRDYVRHIRLVDDKTDVNLRRPLRDHPDIHVADGPEDFRGNSRCAADVLAHQTNNRLAALVLHVGQPRQVGGDSGNRFIGIHGDGNTDLGSRDHVHRAAVVGEHLKDAFQEPMGHQHARSHHVHHRDAL